MATKRPDGIDEYERNRRERDPTPEPDDYADTAVYRMRAEAKQPERLTPGGERYEQNILDRSIEALRRVKGGQTWTDWEAIAEGIRVITARVLAETGAEHIQA